MRFYETSAKTGLNVQEAFTYLSTRVKEKREADAKTNGTSPYATSPDQSERDTGADKVRLTEGGKNGKGKKDGKKKGCC
jgi:hypothetical protein